MQNIPYSRWLLLTLGLVCVPLSAQDVGAPAPAPAAAPPPEILIPADPYERGTPLRSAEGFIRVTDNSDFETAAEYLDLRNLRGDARQLTGAQLARRFHVVIQRGNWADIDELVDHPDGRQNDNLPEYRDSIGLVEHEGRELRLYMQKVPRGDGVNIWKVSNASVALIPKLYDTYGYPEYIEELRRALPSVTIFGYELFKWAIVLAIGPLAYLAVFLIALIVRRVLGDPDTPSHRRIFRFFVIPAGIWFVILSMNLAATTLGRGLTAEAWARYTPIPTLVTVWVLFAGMNLLRDVYSTRLGEKGRPGAVVLMHPAANALKLLVALGAALVYLDQLGINITTVLAGLGVGGIAVALALQKPMEDIFGAVTLYTQQPVRIGDFCQIGDETGTIEEIGLRTTRVRTLANTIIAVPNARLAQEPIINISARRMILYRPTLRLPVDTGPEQLQAVLDGVRELFKTHERVLADDQRVRFKSIADDALLIEAYAYVNTTDWAEYLGIAEELNMAVLDIVAKAGTRLALPAQTLHVENR